MFKNSERGHMTQPTQIDPKLIEFATPTQAKYIEATNRLGSMRKAAAELGLTKNSVQDAINRVKAEAARRGYAPGHFADGVAPGYMMGKVTVQRGPNGVERVWERQHPEAQAVHEAIEAIIEAAREKLPRVKPTAGPRPADSKLCNLFTLTDAHIGALAWHREGGADWDLGIAERTILGAFQHMISTAPRARRAVVAFLGDVMHQDSNKALTPAHGHLLDADSRPRKIINSVVRIMRTIIAMALATHDEVHVVCGEGNHDEYTSGNVLPEVFAILYENEPRVTVNDAVLPYYVVQHGRVMLGFHHGHKRAPAQLPLFFATAHPAMWGATTKRYAHCGHRHHVEEKEHSGMKVVQHSTLAARDAHASRGGWFSERQAIAITYHEEYGEVGRITVTPEMLAA
jgi:hypothetical protein